MSEYGQTIARIKREMATEQRVRAMDAADIVEEIHKHEDAIERLEEWISELIEVPESETDVATIKKNAADFLAAQN